MLEPNCRLYFAGSSECLILTIVRAAAFRPPPLKPLCESADGGVASAYGWVWPQYQAGSCWMASTVLTIGRMALEVLSLLFSGPRAVFGYTQLLFIM